MAKITSSSEEKVFKISEWLGLNENPDGDTRLKLGEAAVMRNFKITRDGSLQKRPGLGTCFTGENRRYFLKDSGKGSYLYTTSNLLTVYERVFVDEQTGEVTYSGSVTLDAATFAGNEDISAYIMKNSLTIESLEYVEVVNEKYYWHFNTLEVASVLLTDNTLGLYTLAYSDGTNASITIRTASPELAVHENISVDSITGEISLGDEIILQADSFEMEDFANIYVDGEKRYGILTVDYDSQNAEYVWEGDLIVSVKRNRPIDALWTGSIGGAYRVVAVSDRKLWEIHNGKGFTFKYIGFFAAGTGADISVFDYADLLYIVANTPQVDGTFYHRYYYWDGKKESIEPVEGYWPVVAISVSPQNGTTPEGTLLERTNLLVNRKRIWLSPDKNYEYAVYVLPEGTSSIVYVKSLVSGDVLSSSNYKLYNISWHGHSRKAIFFGDTEDAGTFLDENVGINTIEVCVADEREVLQLKALFPDGGKVSTEKFNGVTDNRLFMCSSTSNKVYYSGLDYNGKPRADYFPDLNVVSVGEPSDVVTGLIRHYSRLIVFKEHSTYAIQYGTLGLADGTTTAAFYCTPINKRIGNEAFGQVQLVLNSPRTLHGKDLYEWRNNSSYSSNLSVDERQAKRISDRIYQTLASFDFSKCYCYDDNDHQEYYIICDKRALVHNYAVDAWYYYDNFDVTCMVNFGGELYAGDSQGRFNLVSRTNRTDNGEEITAYWESGSEPFGRDFMRKYSAMLWVGVKPELRSQVDVTVITDRSGNLSRKTVAASLATFEDADFRDWSFNTNRMPQMSRLKIKAKKFVHYKLIFEMSGENTTATIVSADVRVRFTGYAR